MKGTRREYYGEHLYHDIPVALDAAREDDDDDADERDREVAGRVFDAVLDALRSSRRGDSRRGRDASERLSPIEQEFGSSDRRRARDGGSNANIGTAPSGSKTGDRARARGRDETDHRKDFEPNRGTTADSRFGFSRTGSVDIDEIWGGSA